ncbi:helix-turn-helix domain-containing protein [Nocardia tengchongensis]|uniref:helix-turn-helix domain-containing protein n=1 Tax=Nocardia tengchongensis TaxID=2055889 RepID=UPI0036AF86B0
MAGAIGNAHTSLVGRALRQLDSRTSAEAAFGAELRAHRERAGWSQAELAKRVYVSRALMGMLERAERRPSRALAARLDQMLTARGELVLLASVFLEEDRPALDGLTPDTAEHILRASIAEVRRDDHTMAADQLHDVVRYLKAAEAVADSASEVQRAGLWRAVAEAQQLTAWISFDRGYRRQAETILARARVSAEKAQAFDLVAYIGGPNSGFIHTWHGDPARGVELAYGALAWANRSGNKRLSAFVATIAARAHARLNESDLCRQMLSLAESDLDRHHSADQDPDWLTVFDHTALAGHRGSCLLDLGHPRQAVDALYQQQSARSGAHVRNNAIWQLERAIADLEIGEYESAAATIEQTLDYVGDGPVTPRVVQVFRAAGRSLQETAGAAVTSAARERLRDFIAVIE